MSPTVFGINRLCKLKLLGRENQKMKSHIFLLVCIVAVLVNDCRSEESYFEYEDRSSDYADASAECCEEGQGDCCWNKLRNNQPTVKCLHSNVNATDSAPKQIARARNITQCLEIELWGAGRDFTLFMDCCPTIKSKSLRCYVHCLRMFNSPSIEPDLKWQVMRHRSCRHIEGKDGKKSNNPFFKCIRNITKKWFDKEGWTGF